ncbi:MAG: HPF/RaiA family ribosome-associated protein [Deltaproteobacteria bacterium]|nr:HPF/RaiA family ribosome-associated protein [Deltaproteobacteria bacterium]
MRVSIRQRNLELPAALRRDIDRRVRFAMSRLVGAGAVEVTVLDDNGPKGGLDKLCRISVPSGAGGPLCVEARSHEVMAAVADACHRAARVLARDRGRAREDRRS